MTADRPSSTTLDAFGAFETAGWERQAPTYDRFFGRITRRLADPLLDAAGVGAGTRVLDVATGPGYVAGRAAERGASVVAVDVAPAMVGLARRLHPDLDVRAAAAESLPFREDSFQAVVGNFVVPHLSHHERAVTELTRVLRPRGRLALTTWDVPERMRLLGVFLDVSAEVGAEPPADIPAGPPFFRFAVDEAFAALLAGSGLTDVVVETVAFTHDVRSAAELWDGMLSGTVRTSAFVAGQPADVRARIRAAFDRRMVDYRSGDGFSLPVSVKLASGRKA